MLSRMTEPRATTADRTVAVVFLATIALGGSNAVAIRVGAAELPPIFAAALRFALAAGLLVALAAVVRPPLPRGRRLLGAVLYGLINFAAGYAFIYVGLLDAPAGVAQLVLAVAPLLTLLLAVGQGLERFRWPALAGSLVAAAGILVVFGDQLTTKVPILALLALLGSALCVAQTNVVVKRIPPGHPIAANAIGMAIGATVLAVLSLVVGESWALPTRPETWASVGYLATVGSVGLFLAVLYVLARWTASAASYALLAMPLWTVVLAAVVLREPITPAFAIGAALVIVGTYLGVFRGAAGPRGPGPRRSRRVPRGGRGAGEADPGPRPARAPPAPPAPPAPSRRSTKRDARSCLDPTDPPARDARRVEAGFHGVDPVRRHGREQPAGRLGVMGQRHQLRRHTGSDCQVGRYEPAVVGRAPGLHAGSREFERAVEYRKGSRLEPEPRARGSGHLEPVAEQPEARDVGRCQHLARDEHLRGRPVERTHLVHRRREVRPRRPAGPRAAHEQPRAEPLGQHEDVPGAGAALAQKPVRVRDADDRQPVLGLRVADCVAARQDAAGLADRRAGAVEDRGERRRWEVVGERGDREREEDAAAHREDVAQRVRGRDLAVRPRVVDDRREEVERPDDGHVRGNEVNRGVVRRVEAGQELLRRRLADEPGEGAGQQVRAELGRTAAALGQFREADRRDGRLGHGSMIGRGTAGP